MIPQKTFYIIRHGETVTKAKGWKYVLYELKNV
jgi:hypothetical protein